MGGKVVIDVFVLTSILRRWLTFFPLNSQQLSSHGLCRLIIRHLPCWALSSQLTHKISTDTRSTPKSCVTFICCPFTPSCLVYWVTLDLWTRAVVCSVTTKWKSCIYLWSYIKQSSWSCLEFHCVAMKSGLNYKHHWGSSTCWSSSAFTLDGVNLKGYFAYALNDQRDPGFGLYGHVQDEVIVKASLSNYRNIIQHNGFPIEGAAPQQCVASPQPCPGCRVLMKSPVVGFLTLVGSGVLITLGLIIYYTAKRHKECYSWLWL